jgi:hypothetical protein
MNGRNSSRSALFFLFSFALRVSLFKEFFQELFLPTGELFGILFLVQVAVVFLVRGLITAVLLLLLIDVFENILGVFFLHTHGVTSHLWR